MRKLVPGDAAAGLGPDQIRIEELEDEFVVQAAALFRFLPDLVAHSIARDELALEPLPDGALDSITPGGGSN